MPVPQPPLNPAPKRLCIFSDGTWATADRLVPTNIVTLCRAVLPTSHTAVPQVAFYDPGVGTGDSVYDRLAGGAFGAGIDLNIKQLYTFLALNYSPGDEIDLFGYSRGAYTVRSLVGLIHHAGLVTREHLPKVNAAYELYRSRASADGPVATAFRAAHGPRVPIKLLACFDTVGALGLPFDAPWPLSALFDHERYRFHDTSLSPLVEHAVHALAVDEDRRGFMPTPMTPCAERGEGQVTELFLPGYHGGVGGGNQAEKALGDNALRFMVDEMVRRGIGLDLDMSLIPDGGKVNVEPRDNSGQNMYRMIKMFSGDGVRDVRSVECLHETAVKRFCFVPKWRPPALKDFEQAILERFGDL